jgi:hypothetical protein
MTEPDLGNILKEISSLQDRLMPAEGDNSFRKKYPYSGFEF